MQRNYNDILLQILDIIQYQNDKESFLSEFNTLNHNEAVANILDRFSEEEQEIIINANGPAILQQYLTRQDYIVELTKVSAVALERFIDDIQGSLSEEQKEKIADVLSEH